MIIIVLHVQLDARSYSIFDRAGTSAGAGAGTGTGAGTGVPVPVRGGGRSVGHDLDTCNLTSAKLALGGQASCGVVVESHPLILHARQSQESHVARRHSNCRET